MTPSKKESLLFSSVNGTFPHLQGDRPYRQKVLAFFQQSYYLQAHTEELVMLYTMMGSKQVEAKAASGNSSHKQDEGRQTDDTPLLREDGFNSPGLSWFRTVSQQSEILIVFCSLCCGLLFLCYCNRRAFAIERMCPCCHSEVEKGHKIV